jgi:hypothetical protein
MRTAQEKTIKGNTYRVKQLGAKEGRRVLARLLQILGGGVAGLAEAFAGDGGKVSAFKGVQAIADQMTPEQMDFFCDTFAKLTQVTLQDGKTPLLSDVFDEHFAGNYWEMTEWLLFALEVNFGNFLDASGTIGNLFSQPKGKQPSVSPQGSTGTSGAL